MSTDDTRIDVKNRREEIARSVEILSRNCSLWSNMHFTGLTTIQVWTVVATIIMGVNLILKCNGKPIEWFPFCLTTLVLNGLVAYFVNGQKNTIPNTYRQSCQDALNAYRSLSRKIGSTAGSWDETRMKRFYAELKKVEKAHAHALEPPPKIRADFAFNAIGSAVVVIYIAYIAMDHWRW